MRRMDRENGWMRRRLCAVSGRPLSRNGMAMAMQYRCYPKIELCRAMNDLARRLKTLRRTVLMLETELRHGRLDEALITEIDAQMERGIASEPRCAQLVKRVDDLRESTLTPRTELLGDTIRACEKLRDGIDEVVGRL